MRAPISSAPLALSRGALAPDSPPVALLRLPPGARKRDELPDREAPVAHQGVRVDVPASEIAERDIGRDRVADAEDGVAQTPAGRLVVEAARLDKRLDHVG